MSTTPTIEPWDSLLETGRADERLVHEDRYASPCAAPGRHPGRTELEGRPGARDRRDRAPVCPPGGGPAPGVRRPDDRHHRNRIGQVLVFSAADARGPDLGSRRPGALHLPHEGTGAGPGPLARPVRPAQADTPGDLRRRHAPAGALGDPQAQQPGDHQPRHAPRRDPAPPRHLGRPVLQPRLRGRR